MRQLRMAWLALLAMVLLATPVAAAPTPATSASPAAPTSKVIFFASDGLRQDLVTDWQNQLPAMRQMLKLGAMADGNGML
ncbi:MAG TPA: hypothetical protein VFT99_18930, partial [Roseiflexaceae bacterium]|nr:hypothetical protein [Roseiflexaceae bacterium]